MAANGDMRLTAYDFSGRYLTGKVTELPRFLP